MANKITVSIDKGLIEKAKVYAASQNKSLSGLIESYLRSIIAQEASELKITPKVKSLSGAFKAPADFDYKKVLQEEIIRKHG